MTDLGYDGQTCACGLKANIPRRSAGFAVGPPSWRCRCGRDNLLNWSGDMRYPHEDPDMTIGEMSAEDRETIRKSMRARR
jgi:hypothetical protein